MSADTAIVVMLVVAAALLVLLVLLVLLLPAVLLALFIRHTVRCPTPVEALLLSSGWRVRAVPGSHACVGEVVDRWLSSEPDPAERIAAKFAASRKARREDEYPHPASRQRTSSELRVLAQDNVRLVNLVREWLGLEPQLHLVPTDANVRDFGG